MLSDESVDTIVAQATPVGEGAIGIIRLSGLSSVQIISKIFKGSVDPFEFESHRLYFGKICEPESGEIMDEVLAVWMKKPHSFTGEDVVEIQGHGGPIVLQRIIRLIVDLGGRLAEPGEFSKRAFLNGKMDLSQAEGVANLIAAKSDWQAKNALWEMGGFLKRTIQGFEEKILELLARLEVGFDFVEEDIQLFDRKWGIEILTEIQQEIKKLLDSFQTGQLLKEGLKIVLVGRPNVGKSSLLNVLLNEDRAIVHEKPGTTRDVLNGERKIEGILASFYDTAGIRSFAGHMRKNLAPLDVAWGPELVEGVPVLSSEAPFIVSEANGQGYEVEQEGIRRSEEWIKKADLLLCLLDSSSPLTEDDHRLLEQTGLKPRIIIYSKSDLPPAWDRLAFPLTSPSVSVSSKERSGVNELINTIYDVSIKSKILYDHNYVLNNVRYKSSLDKVYNELSIVTDLVEKNKISEECLVEELRIMLDELKGITGEITNDKVLDEIFSKFCIGK